MDFRNYLLAGYVENERALDQEPSPEDQYADTEELRNVLSQLKGEKFILDCGHKVTFGHFLGNDITIRNGKIMKIICSQCGY